MCVCVCKILKSCLSCELNIFVIYYNFQKQLYFYKNNLSGCIFYLTNSKHQISPNIFMLKLLKYFSLKKTPLYTIIAF